MAATPVRPATHCLVYGDSGSYKSTFAGTWPKPLLVMAFDPYGKDAPYWRLGEPSGLEMDDLGSPIRTVASRKSGRLLARIEHYLDEDPERPDAYARFRRRMATLRGDAIKEWATLVIDSVTFMELAARKLEQYKLNPTARDPRQWYAGSKEALEEMLLGRVGALPINVVVICHVDEDKDELHGQMVRNPAAPGKLSKRLPAGYSELYRAYVTRDDAGQRVPLLQTRGDAMYNASTQIPAPDPCDPVYTALWSEADERRSTS